jgi:DNA-binding transcriptional MerR regulator
MKGQYSIKDLERLTGIKAHTLRIWEKRYGIISPERTDTNIRYYDDEELKKVLNIVILNNYGIKISKIVGLTAKELHEKVVEISNEELSEKVQVESLVVAMVEMDEPRFEKILANCVVRLGFEETMMKVIYPFFKKVGVLWQTGAINPAQEHFMTNLIRQKLIVAIDSQGLITMSNSKRFLLFLPEGELHEIGLLFYNYLTQKAGHKVIYLGQSVPIKDVIAVNAVNPAHYIITSALSLTSIEDINALLQRLLDSFPQAEIMLTNQVEQVDELLSHKRLHTNKGLEGYKEFLATV